jgi:acyl-CoA reductase-like NAD-dependent aldehyde dehydrogenase
MSSHIDMSTKHFGMLIDGAIVSARDDGYFESVNPSNGEVFATVANATTEDMAAAIQAASAAFNKGTWKNFSLSERGIYLRKIAKLIREHAKELAELESLDTGKTLKQTTFIDVPTCADTFDYFGSLTNELEPKTNPVSAPVKSSTHFDPYGVVGSIIPWNYPLIMFAWKAAPALITGNAVVFKPSPLGSISIMRLAQILVESGLPKGVLNIVPTDKPEAAKALVKDPGVDMISFTGGSDTGKEIMRLASSESVKKVVLELGGKSPNIVFADCDMEAAVGGTLSAIFMNQGQMCTAGSRLLLDEKIYDEFLNKVVERTKALKIGPATDYETQFGPVINQQHRDDLLKFIQKGIEEGAKLECGGKIPEGDQFKQGSYIEPTILSKVDNAMSVAQKEAFGPVLSVIKFSDLDEAVRVANDSKYGLAACVWTRDKSIPHIVARELQCGTVWVNTYGGFYNEAPFGGYKQSGFGRELGLEGLLEYTQSKHVCIDQTPGGVPLPSAWF